MAGTRWQARRRAVIRRRRRTRLGRLGDLYTGIGPHRELVGRRVAGLARAAAREPRASIQHRFDDVRRPGGIVPAQGVAGTLEGDDAPRPGRAIAIAVNGRIEGVGQTFELPGSRASTTR